MNDQLKEILSDTTKVKILKEMIQDLKISGHVIPLLNSLEKFDFNFTAWYNFTIHEMEGVMPAGTKPLIEAFDIPYDDLPLYINDENIIKQTLIIIRLKNGA
jgi:hypothetical protein